MARQQVPLADVIAAELAEMLDRDAQVIAAELERLSPPPWKRMSRRELADLWAALPPEGHAWLAQMWGRRGYEEAQREAVAQLMRDWALKSYLEAYG